MQVWHRLALVSAVMMGLLAAQPTRAQNPGFVAVTKTADTNDGVCSATDCSLREAINLFDTGIGGTIMLPAGTYTLTIAGANENAGATGDLDILGFVSITGTDAASTIIDANGIDRALHIIGDPTVQLSNVTIRNGNITQTGIDGRGGGILSEGGTLTLTNVIVTENQTSNATGDGAGIALVNTTTIITNSTISENDSIQNAGGILNLNGSLTIENSTINGNSTGPSGNYEGGGLWNTGVTASAVITRTTFSDNDAVQGGGISSEVSASLMLSNSVVSGNTAQTAGGVLNFGVLDIVHSTISGNTADWAAGFYSGAGGVATITTSTIGGNIAANSGGGISNDDGSVLTLTNSTLVSNTAVNSGGGIHTLGELTIIDSTIAGNSAASGGGIARPDNFMPFSIRNSIVANNTGGDCSINAGGSTSLGYNLSSDASCAASFTATGDQNSTDPLLGTLGNTADGRRPSRRNRAARL